MLAPRSFVLSLFALATACAASPEQGNEPSPTTDELATESSALTTVQALSPSLLQPTNPLIPGGIQLPPLVLRPTWVATCGGATAPSTRYVVRTTRTSCSSVRSSDGLARWIGSNSVSGRFTEFCNYSWYAPDGRQPDYWALDRIAVREFRVAVGQEVGRVQVDCRPQPVACIGTSCTASLVNYRRPLRPVPIVDPCSTCGSIYGNQAFVSYKSDGPFYLGISDGRVLREILIDQGGQPFVTVDLRPHFGTVTDGTSVFFSTPLGLETY